MKTLQETTPPCGGNSLRQRKLAILTVIDGGTAHLGRALRRNHAGLVDIKVANYNSSVSFSATPREPLGRSVQEAWPNVETTSSP